MRVDMIRELIKIYDRDRGDFSPRVRTSYASPSAGEDAVAARACRPVSSAQEPERVVEEDLAAHDVVELTLPGPAAFLIVVVGN